MRKFADWSKAPKWANYHTVDKSGVGWWWENSPTRGCGMWNSWNAWNANKGKAAVSGFFKLRSIAWDDTLEARPTEVEHLLVGAGGGRGSGSTTSLNGGPATEGSDLTPGGASDGVVHENYFLAADSGGAGGSPRYGSLRRVLDLAYDQSAKGKGKERHANDKHFDEQPIMQISRMVGLGFPTGQVQKKVQEAGGMVAAGRPEAAQAELLGAIVYCAAAWLLIEESK